MAYLSLYRWFMTFRVSNNYYNPMVDYWEIWFDELPTERQKKFLDFENEIKELKEQKSREAKKIFSQFMSIGSLIANKNGGYYNE